jgi:hypothetical protein
MERGISRYKQYNQKRGHFVVTIATQISAICRREGRCSLTLIGESPYAFTIILEPENSAFIRMNGT